MRVVPLIGTSAHIYWSLLLHPVQYWGTQLHPSEGYGLLVVSVVHSLLLCTRGTVGLIDPVKLIQMTTTSDRQTTINVSNRVVVVKWLVQIIG